MYNIIIIGNLRQWSMNNERAVRHSRLAWEDWLH